MSNPNTSIATFGAGCYWCVEAVLVQVPGVLSMSAGFMGGHIDNPTYEAVCAGITGHAEVLQVEFDPGIISYRELLGWFWKLHDPTTLNFQGGDVGTQYRSAIYFHDAQQETEATESRKLADASGVFENPIVTEITAASTFFRAKEDHQDYYRQNKDQGYCRMVIQPKLEKLGLEY
ncbi:MAG: peptide-methionine (S)-S-oxide reductase MsrA [Planctomycetota bacterium]|mgnify:FL=1|jgi:peptide-methionine (S)-S-oxide reductase|nr:peptide-methionine (S)-S-oxide reductase MsrA [Planctomycetota bacterium]MDG2142258.1 peptide-methionine (S)-S-oxide reductase MsrA [Planctomycetota bacterium]